MIRLLILGALGYLVYQLFAGGKKSSPGRRSGSGSGRKAPGSTTGGGRMVKCAACGLYVPEDEAISRREGGKEVFYCSRQCAAGKKG